MGPNPARRTPIEPRHARGDAAFVLEEASLKTSLFGPTRLDAAQAMLLETVDNHAHRGIAQVELTRYPTTIRPALVLQL